MRAKRTSLKAAAACAAISACVLLAEGAQASPVHAFGPGEKLEYALKWAGITAGDSVMEVVSGEGQDGVPLYRVISTAESRAVVDVFYKVRNRYETHVSPVDGLPRKYVFMQDEGGKKKNRVLIFDQERRIVTRIVKEGDRTASQVFEIPEGTQDNLSSLYAMRNETFSVGDRVAFRVFEGKRNWELIVEVLAAEEIEVQAGRFRTLKLHPILKYEGLFRRKGDLHVWVTDDERHIPVLMRSKVSIGSIVAELVRYRLADGQIPEPQEGP